jgi:DNA-binding transcriptional regulator GbsR (MarR family)
MVCCAAVKTTCEEVQQEFIQLWARMSRFWGVSSATARVYAWLMAHANGGDTDDIMAGLDMGRGTVSMACKELREWGLILSESTPGARRTRHHVEANLAKVVRNIIQQRKRREWDPVLEHLRTWIPRLENERTPEAAVFRERLRAVEAFLGRSDELARAFLEGGALSHLALAVLVGAASPPRPKETHDS